MVFVRDFEEKKILSLSFFFLLVQPVLLIEIFSRTPPPPFFNKRVLPLSLARTDPGPAGCRASSPTCSYGRAPPPPPRRLPSLGRTEAKRMSQSSQSESLTNLCYVGVNSTRLERGSERLSLVGVVRKCVCL